MAARDPRLRAFVKINKRREVVPGTLILRLHPPEGGQSNNWLEIQTNVCCGPLSSTYEFDQSPGSTASFNITIDGQTLVSAVSSVMGSFLPGGGQSITATIPAGGGGNRTLVVVNETTQTVLNNTSGTGALTYTFVTGANNVYNIIGAAGTTTTSTTTTSTTTTSTTSTSTTTTTT